MGRGSQAVVMEGTDGGQEGDTTLHRKRGSWLGYGGGGEDRGVAAWDVVVVGRMAGHMPIQ